MLRGRQDRSFSLRWLVLLVGLLGGTGCCGIPKHRISLPDALTEQDKGPLPEYILEPPDIILIDAIRTIPKPPYRIEPLDALFVNVANPLAEPISGVVSVEPDGTINLGARFGPLRVEGMTIEEAKAAVVARLKPSIKDPLVQVSLAQSRALQQIRGEHLIRPDGTVGLGSYGSVPVAGLTLREAKQAIEAFLSQFLLRPEVSVDVFAYNSKVYYIITDGAGFGEAVYRFATTGNETVLDAISQITGLPPVSSKKRIWVARPVGCDQPEQILPVDWRAITRHGSTVTNYQILPGDRIYVQAQPLITVDTYLARIITPIERLLGVTLLGNAVVEAVQAGNASGVTGGVVR